MKNFFVCLLLFISNPLSLLAQESPLIIKGRVKCIQQSPGATKGAENIVVVPAFRPPKATLTASYPTGYFEFNTGVPLSKLKDKIITLYAVSRCADCREVAKRIFVSEDQDRRNRSDNKTYVTIKDWMLKTQCSKAELIPQQADSVLNVLSQQPGQDLDRMSAASALTGTPAFLNVLSSLTTVVGVGGAPGIRYGIQSLEKRKIHFGKLLHSMPFIASANMGFNFSPSRDMSEAVFWNPAAMIQHRKKGNLSVLTNSRNNVKAGGFYAISDKLSLGAGFMASLQDEYKKTNFAVDPFTKRDEDSLSLQLREMSANVSAAYAFSQQLSFGFSAKLAWQTFNIPDSLFCDNQGFGTFSDSTIKRQFLDFDFSVSYKPLPNVQLGVNCMNGLNRALFADAFLPQQLAIPLQRQRSIGIGATYKYRRWNIGTDLLINKQGFYDMSIGLNVVPFNNMLLTGGYAVQQGNYSLSLRMKHFRIAFLHDNNYFFNESRVPKHKLLNGRIHGGFVIDLQ